MKKKMRKSLLLMMIIMISLPLILFTNTTEASAKKSKNVKHNPKISCNNQTLYDQGDTFTLYVSRVGSNVASIDWYSEDDDIAVVKVTNDTRKAIVTAQETGSTYIHCIINYNDGYEVSKKCKVKVMAYTNDEEEDDSDEDSDTVKVENIQLTEANTLKIAFSKAVNSSTVIGQNNSLLGAVAIAVKVDQYGNAASAYGTLTATLGDNGKSLFIKASNIFHGLYSIRLLSTIKATDGSSLEEYYKDITLKDTAAPVFKNYTLDSSGLIVTLNFSEAMDFSGMQIVGANVTSPNQSIDLTTINILYTKTNYVVSADRKSLTINLTNIAAADRNKALYVQFYGLKDLSGNSIQNTKVEFTTKIVSPTPTAIPLPAPVTVNQLQNDPSTVEIRFNARLDEVTAENKTNYTILGVGILSAELTNYTNTSLVTLKLQPGSITTSKNYTLIMNGIKGYNNSYSQMSQYINQIYLIENVGPSIISYAFSYPNVITLTFDEKVSGVPSFTIVQKNNVLTAFTYYNDNKVIIMLKETPVINEYLQIIPDTNNNITDLYGNKMTTLQPFYVYSSYTY